MSAWSTAMQAFLDKLDGLEGARLEHDGAIRFGPPLARTSQCRCPLEEVAGVMPGCWSDAGPLLGLIDDETRAVAEAADRTNSRSPALRAEMLWRLGLEERARG